VSPIFFCTVHSMKMFKNVYAAFWIWIILICGDICVISVINLTKVYLLFHYTQCLRSALSPTLSVFWSRFL